MAFKIKAPYHIDNTPIYKFEKEDGVLGRANKNGTVNIRCDMEPEQEKQVIAHELGHVDQFKEGRLDYFNDHIIWDGKKMARKKSPPQKKSEQTLRKSSHTFVALFSASYSLCSKSSSSN